MTFEYRQSDICGEGPADSENRFTVRPNRHAPYLRIHCVKVFVRDQEQSLRFYGGQLGFALAFDVRLPSGTRWVGVAPPDGTAILALVVPTPDSAEYKLVGRSNHVIFVAEDVIGRYQDWCKRGIAFLNPPQDSSWGGTFATFEDPDGNSFTLVSFDELSRAIEAERRAIVEKMGAERLAAHELEIARQVQARLFPQRLPFLSTLEYAGICVQARQVGGDYYDFLDLGGGRLALVIGDIAGKGMPAALLMANLQASVRSQCAIALDRPRRFLRSVNHLFQENTTDSAYATLFFAEYDETTQQLRYANCGHPSALLLRRDNTLERLDSTCPVLGLFREWDASVEQRQLLPGDTLVLYTDGVTESLNDAGEEFGEDRLIEALRRYHDLPPQALLSAVVDEARRFSSQEQQDDITLVVAKARGTDGVLSERPAAMADRDYDQNSGDRSQEQGSFTLSAGVEGELRAGRQVPKSAGSGTERGASAAPPASRAMRRSEPLFKRLLDSWFAPKRFETTTLYESLGVLVVKRYVPTGGDFVRRRYGVHIVDIRGNLESLVKFERCTRKLEAIHVIAFLGFLTWSLWRAIIHRTTSVDFGVAILVYTILILSPAMLQRYNRLRVHAVIQRMTARQSRIDAAVKTCLHRRLDQSTR